MTTWINKSLSGDFSQGLREDRLLTEINDDPGISAICLNVVLNPSGDDDDVVRIFYDSVPSAGDQTQTDVVIAAHNGGEDPLIVLVGGGNYDTQTTVTTTQTSNRTITLPDADGTVPLLDNNVTLTNKNIDANNNTLSNIGDEELTTGIDAAKLADGSVSNTEFQYINSLTSNVQTQINNHVGDADIHVDHKNVDVLAGEGLSGGGDISATRTLNLNVNGLTEETDPNGASDSLVIWDFSASGHKKVLINNLPLNHDRQYVFADNEVDTGSSTYIDLDAMSITTADLGGPGTYNVTFTVSHENNSNRKSYFRLLQDSVEKFEVITEHRNNHMATAAIAYQASNVAAGTVFKIQYASESGGDLDVFCRALRCDGILD